MQDDLHPSNILTSLFYLTSKDTEVIIRLGNEAEMTSEARLNRLERIARLLVRAGMRGRARIREHDDKINILLNAQIKTEESLVTLAESQTHTDRRLDALIDIIRGGR